jgi:hypothetical protein
MNQLNDQMLCDYIFDLLDDKATSFVEHELQNSMDAKQRYRELLITFESLDELKDELVSPVNDFKKLLHKVSAVAALFICSCTFWAFSGESKNETIESHLRIVKHNQDDHFLLLKSKSCNMETAIKCHVGASTSPGLDLKVNLIEMLTINY